MDEFGGQVALVQGHGDTVGLCRHLCYGVANATIVTPIVTRRDDEQAILDVEKWIAHKINLLVSFFVGDILKLLQLREYKPGSDDLEKQTGPANDEVGNRSIDTASEEQFTKATNGLADENNTDDQWQADRLEALGSEACNKGENGEFQRHHRQYGHSGHPRQHMVHQR